MALPEDIVTKVQSDFSEDDSLLILQMLSELQKENSELFSDRILRCIVVFMHGNAERFDKAVALARIDWRDLIGAAEYHWGNRVRLLALPFDIHPDVELFKQWLTGRQILIPWRKGYGDEKWTIESREIRELSIENVDQLKNVKHVSQPVLDPSFYFAHLSFLCIRGLKEISASQAFEAKAFICYRLQPETRRFAFKKFWYRPQDVTKRGKW